MASADGPGRGRTTVVCLGDSLTEQAWALPESPSQSGWLAQLAHRTRRRYDFINLGLSGYNTRWVRAALLGPGPTPLATLVDDHVGGRKTEVDVTHQHQHQHQHPAIITTPSPSTIFLLWLGANDAADPTHPYELTRAQAVPVDEYRSNLTDIATYLLRGFPDARLVVLPPPLPHAETRRERNPHLVADRTPERTALYHDACVETIDGLYEAGGGTSATTTDTPATTTTTTTTTTSNTNDRDPSPNPNPNPNPSPNPRVTMVRHLFDSRRAPPPSFYSDGLHLSAEGSAAVADYLYEHIFRGKEGNRNGNGNKNGTWERDTPWDVPLWSVHAEREAAAETVLRHGPKNVP